MEERLTTQLTALAHPQRRAVFRLLVRRAPDAVPAGEIAQALALKASTTSVYLSTLRHAGLITQTRSGTSLCYGLDVSGAGGMAAGLFADCCRGRADLCAPLLPVPQASKPRVLFICSGNSARSIMAEALLRHVAGARFAVFSAGTNPRDVANPAVLALLAKKGVATDGLRPQPMTDFTDDNSPHYVFTLCDRAANEDCPTWPGLPVAAHWGLPDPSRAADPRAALEDLYAVTLSRVRAFADLPLTTFDPPARQRAVDAIPLELTHP